MNQIKNQKKILLQVDNLKVHFPIKRGLLKKTVGYIKAVDGINLFIKKRETLGLVGESGCGKTTCGRAIIRLIQSREGTIFFRGENEEIVPLHELRGEELRKKRREFQIIFQDPFSSLNPRKTVEEIVSDPLLVNNIGDSISRRNQVIQLLNKVGLSEDQLKRFPNEFSGGQRQRIGIARAIALKPKLIVCDEAVSALDVSVQAQILNLLKDIQDDMGFSYLFIAHNLSVIHHICDRIAVMYLGKIVELADTRDLFQYPLHPYTEALLSAIPSPDPKSKPRRLLLKGEVPSPSNPPSGCHFHPRCMHASEICKTREPDYKLIDGTNNHFVSCHHATKLRLQPVNYQNIIGRNQLSKNWKNI